MHEYKHIIKIKICNEKIYEYQIIDVSQKKIFIELYIYKYYINIQIF